MEQQPEQTMPEVSGDRSFVEIQRSHLTSMIVCAMSGCIVGISMEEWISVKRPADYRQITAAVIIAIVLVQLVWLTRQLLKLRKWKHDLRAERQKLLETYNARVDELLVNDPIEAARVKMQMEEQWPRF